MSVNWTNTNDYIFYIFKLMRTICMQGKLLWKVVLLYTTPLSMLTIHRNWLHNTEN
jgi:hypothetical protein